MKKRLPLLLGLLGFGLILNQLYHSPPNHRHPLRASTLKSTLSSLNNRLLFKKKSTQNPVPPTHLTTVKNPPPEVKLSSNTLTHMTNLLRQSGLKSIGLDSLAKKLENQKMSPHVFKDSNPYTGNMYVLRLETPPPGTRYFHVQYFSDAQNSSPYLQHMSFEIPPSKDAFLRAQQNIKTLFPEISEPVLKTPDFILWHWKNGYNVWIRVLGENQVVDDPFNAYSKEDIGTVRIAMELDVAHND